jgi:hypothetical protein
MLQNVYLGDWGCLEDVLDAFRIDKAEVKGYKVIVASYDNGGYDGDAFVLLKKGRNYYEVNASHCSCYGLEDMWSLEDTTPAALKHRVEKGVSYGAFKSAHDTLKKHFRWETI